MRLPRRARCAPRPAGEARAAPAVAACPIVPFSTRIFHPRQPKPLTLRCSSLAVTRWAIWLHTPRLQDGPALPSLLVDEPPGGFSRMNCRRAKGAHSVGAGAARGSRNLPPAPNALALRRALSSVDRSIGAARCAIVEPGQCYPGRCDHRASSPPPSGNDGGFSIRSTVVGTTSRSSSTQ
jgi:hypothetical protein